MGVPSVLDSSGVHSDAVRDPVSGSTGMDN
jgi:hypothetical protein